MELWESERSDWVHVKRLISGKARIWSQSRQSWLRINRKTSWGFKLFLLSVIGWKEQTRSDYFAGFCHICKRATLSGAQSLELCCKWRGEGEPWQALSQLKVFHGGVTLSLVSFIALVEHTPHLVDTQGRCCARQLSPQTPAASSPHPLSRCVTMQTN